MRKYLLVSSLIILSLTGCFKLKSQSDIALYNGAGADKSCIEATRKMFEWMGYSVKLIDGNYICENELRDFSLICFPGGNMYQYSLDVSSFGNKKIRSYISKGGSYIGICGGAYYTGATVIWQGSQLPMNSLSIFPGTTKGPINEIAPYPECVMCAVNITNHNHLVTENEEDSSWIAYCYGPALLPDNGDVSILGRYRIGGKPSIVAFEYGEGRVFLIGTHPEFEEDSDRDGFEPSESMSDRGSDWYLMEKAVEWCIQ